MNMGDFYNENEVFLKALSENIGVWILFRDFLSLLS